MAVELLSGTYDFSQIVVTVGGVILSGFSDGDAVIARPAEDVFTTRIGNDGVVGRARNPNKTGEFEFRLLATSKANAELSALFTLDSLSNDGDAVVAISVVDMLGTTVVAATQCWIKQRPEVTFGKEVGERAWVFTAADMRVFVGGNR